MSENWLIKPVSKNSLTVQFPDGIEVNTSVNDIQVTELKELIERWLINHEENSVGAMCCALQQSDHFICNSIGGS